MVMSDVSAEVEVAVSCIHKGSGHNYRNSLFIVDLAMGQIPRSTERIFSYATSLVVSTSAVKCVQQLVSKMTS